MSRTIPLLAALLCFPFALHAQTEAPSTAFDLTGWKLQIPGPKEIKKLADYSSGYFFLNADKQMVFHLDASEPGPTRGTHTVRSELRHLPQWTVDEDHTLAGEFRIESHLTPDKVTTMHIHATRADGGVTAPLLRIAMNKGILIAALKTDADADKTDMVPLKKDIGPGFIAVELAVRKGQLTITVDGEKKVTRDISFWPHSCFFKAGCYPQTTEGTVEVTFRRLTVR